MYYKYTIKSLSRAIITAWKKYSLLERKGINEELIKKIAGVLAQIHSTSIPNFLKKESDQPAAAQSE